jgi:hypothetical protein
MPASRRFRVIVSRISAAVINNVAVISPREPQLLRREFLLSRKGQWLRRGVRGRLARASAYPLWAWRPNSRI